MGVNNWKLELIKRRELKDDVNELNAIDNVKEFISKCNPNDLLILIEFIDANLEYKIVKVGLYSMDKLFELIDYVESEQEKEKENYKLKLEKSKTLKSPGQKLRNSLLNFEKNNDLIHKNDLILRLVELVKRNEITTRSALLVLGDFKEDDFNKLLEK